MSMHGPHKDLYENGRSSFIQNRRSISKLWSIHTMEDHLAIKKEQNTDTGNNMAEFQSTMEWEKARYKKYLLYDSTYTTF